MMMRSILVILLVILLTACNTGLLQQPGHDSDAPVGDAPAKGDQHLDYEKQAQLAVIDFYDSLNQGDYDRAAGLYGGPYEVLEGFNPGIASQDHASLLQAGCKFNGLMCLQVQNVSLLHANGHNEFVYEVTYANPDGSQFILGPCCGATEEEMPFVSSFTVRVTCDQEGPCLVLDLPPYVP